MHIMFRIKAGVYRRFVPLSTCLLYRQPSSTFTASFRQMTKDTSLPLPPPLVPASSSTPTGSPPTPDAAPSPPASLTLLEFTTGKKGGTNIIWLQGEAASCALPTGSAQKLLGDVLLGWTSKAPYLRTASTCRRLVVQRCSSGTLSTLPTSEEPSPLVPRTTSLPLLLLLTLWLTTRWPLHIHPTPDCPWASRWWLEDSLPFSVGLRTAP